MHARTLVAVVVAATILLPSGAAAAGQQNAAELMTQISRPSRGDRDRMLARYRFVLPRIVRSCSDVTDDMRAADLIAFTGNKLLEIGLREGYPDAADALHQLVTEAAAIASAQRIQMPKCTELFAMYLTARMNGMGSSDAVNGVAGIYRGLASVVNR